MRIKVTEKHIDDGKVACSWGCPVALAMEDQEGVHGVQVGLATAEWRKDGNVCSGRLPNNAQDFIRAFDDEEPVGPIEFDLEARRVERIHDERGGRP